MYLFLSLPRTQGLHLLISSVKDLSRETGCLRELAIGVKSFISRVWFKAGLVSSDQKLFPFGSVMTRRFC